MHRESGAWGRLLSIGVAKSKTLEWAIPIVCTLKEYVIGVAIVSLYIL